MNEEQCRALANAILAKTTSSYANKVAWAYHLYDTIPRVSALTMAMDREVFVNLASAPEDNERD